MKLSRKKSDFSGRHLHRNSLIAVLRFQVPVKPLQVDAVVATNPPMQELHPLDIVLQLQRIESLLQSKFPQPLVSLLVFIFNHRHRCSRVLFHQYLQLFLELYFFRRELDLVSSVGELFMDAWKLGEADFVGLLSKSLMSLRQVLVSFHENSHL